jgi:hypothetical protein
VLRKATPRKPFSVIWAVLLQPAKMSATMMIVNVLINLKNPEEAKNDK